MSIAIRGLSTMVPSIVLRQDAAAELFASQPGLTPLAGRLIHAAFGGSGVERRHTVIRDLELDGPDQDLTPTFLDRRRGELLLPGTRVRNDLYQDQAGRLFVDAARAALASTPGVGPSDVTHVITVSCTGFMAPGPDFFIARDLGLRPDVQRYQLGFMGCYAALPALRLAKQCCEADASAVVLIVTVELCSLHVRASNEPDLIIANSLFADGAAAAVVTARPTAPGERSLELGAFATRITPDSEQEMAWRIGDHGFEMTLSNAVPAILAGHIVGALEPLAADDAALRSALSAGSASAEVAHWAIHPGGRSILDRVESALGLSADQLAPSRGVLRDYGNMSSATVLFVLRDVLDAANAMDGDSVATMAFGPGLTVEAAMLTVRA
jgi:predicted naringenin-chalcone synthase